MQSGPFGFEFDADRFVAPRGQLVNSARTGEGVEHFVVSTEQLSQHDEDVVGEPGWVRHSPAEVAF
jgi:hypothetical protein